MTPGLYGMNITTQSGAGEALSRLAGAINMVSSARGTTGARQNRPEHTFSREMNMVENTTDSESRIRDPDVAGEMMRLVKADILTQAGTLMSAQANARCESVIRLLM